MNSIFDTGNTFSNKVVECSINNFKLITEDDLKEIIFSHELTYSQRTDWFQT